MEFEDAELGEFLAAGISVHTTNVNGQSQKDISELWTQFMSENIAGKIYNKTGEELYCIYTDYESDYMGPYTTILGYRVNSFDVIPSNYTRKTISESRYNLYKSSGKLPGCVLDTWMAIWQSGIKRKYAADFDVYPPDAFTSANPVVETYVSV